MERKFTKVSGKLRTVVDLEKCVKKENKGSVVFKCPALYIDPV